MKDTGLFVRRSAPADAEAIAHLMNLAFGGEGTESAFDAAWWHWKYGGNPAGYHGLVALDRDGRVVGHYGGVPMDVRADGEWLKFGQNCDSCSDPTVRRGLRNPGLFVRLAQAYASTFALPGGDAVMYGLPNQSVYRIANRYMDYWMLRQQWMLVAEGEPEPRSDASVRIEETAAFDDDVTSFYERLAPRYRCMARRDARFLNWRFRDAPGAPYGITLARNAADGRLRAYAVHRTAHAMGHEAAVVVDWLCDPDDEAAGRALQSSVRRTYAGLGKDKVAFLCPTSSTWFGAFQRFGFRVLPAPYMMVGRPFVAQLEPRYLREHWYYTLADFDIF
ncbi:MAG: hypothetical protein ABL998_02010 [Planctomycetota bacterium]